nr:dna polymerase epsilon subunit c [Quercus suber]
MTYASNSYLQYPQATSIPNSYPYDYDQQYLPQPAHPQHQQQYIMDPGMHMKTEPHDQAMPDVPVHARGRKVQSMPQQYAPDIKSQPPADPTHGVVLKTQFPVARIKRIMQADEDIGKVAQVTPHVVSRALELFMIKLITASAEQAESTGGAGSGKGQKRILCQHMKRAIMATDTFDFLHEIAGKVPDAPSKAKKEAGSDSEEAKPAKKRTKKRKDSGDDF